MVQISKAVRDKQLGEKSKELREKDKELGEKDSRLKHLVTLLNGKSVSRKHAGNVTITTAPVSSSPNKVYTSRGEVDILYISKVT
jgi:hypothetical protein